VSISCQIDERKVTVGLNFHDKSSQGLGYWDAYRIDTTND
jgi:hypothetical protein